MKHSAFRWICEGRNSFSFLILFSAILGPRIAETTASFSEDGDIVGDSRPASPRLESSANRFLAQNSEMASFSPTKKNQGDSVSSNLAKLLENHDLTTQDLATMLLGSSDPTEPEDSENWKALVVTPIEQGVAGQLVQAVLYTNEFRNRENPQRVLAFAGVQSRRNSEAVPDGACLEASYGFKGTQAEGTWHMTCLKNGYTVPNMTEWASQAGALVEFTKATFLTGYKQGCEIAKSEGLLKPHLPVVCWSATGTLTRAWIDAYPGLKEAVLGTKNSDNGTNLDENTKESSVIDSISVNTTTSSSSSSSSSTTKVDDNSNTVIIDNSIPSATQNFNADLRTTFQPENNQIYVIQTFTDPNSNCLLPPEAPGTGLANVCVYPSGSRCDPVNGAPKFDYDMFSRCSDMASLPILLETNLPLVFDEQNCISRDKVGSDTSLRDCPFHNEIYNDVPYEDPTLTWGVDWTESYSMAAQPGGSWAMATGISFSISVVLHLLFFLQY